MAPDSSKYLELAYLNSVRLLAEGGADQDYFRGLVSKTLGSQQMLDDDLLDLVAHSEWLRSIYHDLVNTSLGHSRIDAAVQKEFANLSGDLPEIKDFCRVFWELAVADPRFDLVIKQAIEDAKAPPQVVRGSGLSRMAGVLDRIRSALTSSAARHSNAVLAGSVLAGLLAGSAATKFVPAISNSNSSSSSSPSGGDAAMVSAIHELNRTLAGQNQNSLRFARLEDNLAYEQSMREELQKQVSGLGKLPPDLGSQLDALKDQVAAMQKQVKTIEASSTTTYALGANITEIKKQLGTMSDQLTALERWRNSVPPVSDLKDLAKLSEEAGKIASYLGTQDTAASGDRGGAQSPVLHTVETDLRATNVTLKQITTAVASAIPPSFQQELSFDTVGSHKPFIVSVGSDGAQCSIELTLTTVSAQSATFAIRTSDAYLPAKLTTDPCNNLGVAKVKTIDAKRISLLRTNVGGSAETIDLSLARTTHAPAWPFKPRGVVLWLYQDTHQ